MKKKTVGKINDGSFDGLLMLSIINVKELDRQGDLIKVAVEVEFGVENVEQYFIFWCNFEEFQKLVYEVI
ncbi:MAG: hypothetical protein ACOCP4_07430 [Candidatus Woesearchaeota archaeon]